MPNLMSALVDTVASVTAKRTQIGTHWSTPSVCVLGIRAPMMMHLEGENLGDMLHSWPQDCRTHRGAGDASQHLTASMSPLAAKQIRAFHSTAGKPEISSQRCIGAVLCKQVPTWPGFSRGICAAIALLSLPFLLRQGRCSGQFSLHWALPGRAAGPCHQQHRELLSVFSSVRRCWELVSPCAIAVNRTEMTGWSSRRSQYVSMYFPNGV